jgi:hypothetical protein
MFIFERRRRGSQDIKEDIRAVQLIMNRAIGEALDTV